MADQKDEAVVNGIRGELLHPRGVDEEGNGHSGVYVLPEATRFEIVGLKGGYGVSLEPGATIHIQDGGRTIKIFTNKLSDPEEWFSKSHDWGVENRAQRAALLAAESNQNGSETA